MTLKKNGFSAGLFWWFLFVNPSSGGPGKHLMFFLLGSGFRESRLPPISPTSARGRGVWADAVPACQARSPSPPRCVYSSPPPRELRPLHQLPWRCSGAPSGDITITTRPPRCKGLADNLALIFGG